MKVCVIGLRGLPGVAGGVETHCEQLFPLLRGLRQADEFIILGRSPYLERSTYRYQGLEVVPVFALRSKYFEAISNAVLGVLYARFKAHADLVHIHAIGPSLVAPLAKLLRMKVVITHHGDDYNRSKWNKFAKAVLRLGEYLGVQFCDQMINVSASVTRRMKQNFPRKADIFHHIPNGANHFAGPSGNRAGARTPGAVERFGLTGLRYAICVGRLVPEKRFEDAIAAFDGGGTGFDRLVIVGGAEDESPYRRKLGTYAGKDVVFTGSLPRDEVDQLLASAGLFILPSSHEGLPIAALEAIAANVPVLLSNIEPNLDIKLPAQNYFRVCDVKQIAAKMHADVDDFRIGPSFIERYDWQSISRQTSQVYERIWMPSSADQSFSVLWSRLWPFRR